MSSTTITPQEAELIAKQVKEQLILAQHVAIAHNRNVHIRVDQDTKEFRIRFAIGGDYLVVPFQHSSMLFERMTIFPNSIYFLPNGHPGVSGSFSLRIGDHKYQYTVYLGKGMVAYRKM
ncbi:hypothetical protein JCM9140_4668 [Halalkalibacter wakoensis JCM 9140]|uniref:Late competence protein n=2 Tax=Halalkalibacter wakoensis TaxID=127891 RepID=W4Q9X3_9BACI|nr:hypothetical protein JCM9140_4668 [Halalkalibacter wakoensis JCM 9140]